VDNIISAASVELVESRNEFANVLSALDGEPSALDGEPSALDGESSALDGELLDEIFNSVDGEDNMSVVVPPIGLDGFEGVNGQND